MRQCLVTGCSDGRIPWPRGRMDGSSRSSLVVFGGLADAVRRESKEAIAYWFGVQGAVRKWRKALGVETTNEGTKELRQAHAREEWFAELRAKAR
ncbi:MAG TPA: hypothetical protein VHR66_06960 [Gemmataceae bacterium]|nr:hypothetical protein [Gemmataceae bacterium]